jgi:hypothetical protein
MIQLILVLGMYLKECKLEYNRDTCIPCFLQPGVLQLMSGLGKCGVFLQRSIIQS